MKIIIVVIIISSGKGRPLTGGYRHTHQITSHHIRSRIDPCKKTVSRKGDFDNQEAAGRRGRGGTKRRTEKHVHHRHAQHYSILQEPFLSENN